MSSRTGISLLSTIRVNRHNIQNYSDIDLGI
jgi:hypothetical protein